MANKLSHSSCQRYMKCPESYRLHYVEKLRPNVQSASLTLGSALDEALNSMLLNDGKDPVQVFIDKWSKTYINKQLVDLPRSLQIVYAAKDLDLAILNDKDWLDLDTINVTNVVARKKQAAHINLTEAELADYNFINWVCLRRKGLLILEAYKEQVLPHIKKVITVQKTVNFDNGQGDSITGVIDLIAEWDDGHTYVLDNKSSSMLYDLDSVRTSPQLALYARHEGLTKAGFIVFNKSIKKDKYKLCKDCGYKALDGSRHKTCNNEVVGKRCNGEWLEKVNPKAEIQIILDDTNPKMVEMTMGNFIAVNNLINQGTFFKNTHSCTDWYGGKCSYYNLCHNDKKDGLEKV